MCRVYRVELYRPVTTAVIALESKDITEDEKT